MTTTTKKTAKKNRAAKSAVLPPSAGVAKIAGRDFIIMPLDEFEEWRDEQLFALFIGQRLESGDDIVPFEEIAGARGRGKKGR